MATCTVCGSDVPDDAVSCSVCGSKRGAQRPAAHHWIRIVIFALLLVGVMAAWAWLTGFSLRPG